MNVLHVTDAGVDTDRFIEFNDIEDLCDALEAEIDDDTDEKNLLQEAEDEDDPPYVYIDEETNAVRWVKKRSLAVIALGFDDEKDDE